MLSFVIVLSLVIAWTLRDGELPATVSDAAYSHTGAWRRLPYTLWLWGATFTLTPALFGIIPEEWDAVQDEIARRKQIGNAYSDEGPYTFEYYEEEEDY